MKKTFDFSFGKTAVLFALFAAFLSFPFSLYAGMPGERTRVLIAFKNVPGAAERALVQGYGGIVSHSYRIVPALAASIPEAALAALSKNPKIVVIEPDIEVYAIDAELDNTWGVKRVGAGTVQAGGNRGTGVKVAVIDSGIDYTHPDLAANYAGGYDFVNRDNDPMDDNGHGTHVAGTVAALKNGVGVVGAAPEVRLYALKVLGANGSGSFSNVIAALQWAVDNNIQITNNSYGSSKNPGTIVEAAFANSYAAGVLHVAAAGNSGTPSGKGNNVSYPARYTSVIAVAATNQSDKRASWSSTGPSVELSAPGVSINSTKLGGGYTLMSGTSMASPHVAGVAALVVNAGVTSNTQVRQILRDTATNLGNASWYGYGLVDAVSAVGVVDASPSSPPPSSSGGTMSVSSITYASPGEKTGEKHLR